MTAYANRIDVGRSSIAEIIPQYVTFSALDDGLANTITSITRYDVDAGTSGVAITTKGYIDGNQVTLAKLWLDSETAAAGNYRVKFLVSNPSGTVKLEANLFFEVVA